jgi:hypothetical protein
MRLIAGSGRSGTTWVLDALATANELRPIFEPLHPNVSTVGERYAFRALAPGESHPELRRFLETVCFGKSFTLWTRYRANRRLLFPPLEKLSTLRDVARTYRDWRRFLSDAPWLMRMARGQVPLIKCIRANLMLGWWSCQFECSTVFLVRHPGAVIESKLRGPWNVHGELDRIRGDPGFHELTGDRYRALLGRDLTRAEAMAAVWVIENQWAIEHAARDGVTVVFYECLTTKPEREWQRICHALSLSNLPQPEVIARPSQQSSPAFAGSSGIAAAEPRWMSAMSREQSVRIQEILSEVEFGLYKMSDPEPQLANNPQARHDATRIAR